MASLKGKHQVAEIAGTRCSVIGTGVSEARKAFLTGLLEGNGYTVISDQEKSKDGSPLDTYIVGVTDLLFNPVIVIYQQKLVRQDGFLVTPAYWDQKSTQTDIPYWQVVR
jgi:hypothetical protein